MQANNEHQNLEVHQAPNKIPDKETSMLALAQEHLDEHQRVIASGKWSERITSMCQSGLLQAAQYLLQHMDHLHPAQLPAVMRTLYSIAKTEQGQPSSLSSSLTVNVQGQDLTRDQLMDLITSTKSAKSANLPPRPTNLPKPATPTTPNQPGPPRPTPMDHARSFRRKSKTL